MLSLFCLIFTSCRAFLFIFAPKLRVDTFLKKGAKCSNFFRIIGRKLKNIQKYCEASVLIKSHDVYSLCCALFRVELKVLRELQLIR